MRRLAIISGVPLLHLVAYYLVTRLTSARPPSVLLTTATPLDTWIPYLPWTWPLYWVAYPFVLVGGSAALLRLPPRLFSRAVAAFAAMILVGSVIQGLFPARAPWPVDPAPAQRLFHESALIMPYATLPSMHVAHCTLTAGIIAVVRPGRVTRMAVWAIVGAVALGTLWLKEHVVLDAVTGIALGLGACRWWHRGIEVAA